MADIAAAPPRSIAGIAAFRDHAACLAAVRAEFGVLVPTTPAFIQAGEIRLSCIAPGRVLASGPVGADLPARLADALHTLAAITDQSDLWQTFILSGPDMREVLARLVPIDLHPVQFPSGKLALTRAGHLDIRLWHLADTSYEISVSRSCAADLAHLLHTNAGHEPP